MYSVNFGINDRHYQARIRRGIKTVVKHHLTIMRIQDQLRHVTQKWVMLYMSIFGLLEMASGAYFIYAGLDPENNWKMYLFITVGIINAILFCNCGQVLTDEVLHLKAKPQHKLDTAKSLV
ncbi:unnamed protein product [Callosobruchus maculatus]|uniref:Uncharacterized protein n=1 Tax=Callosobruchus maculatus TaxID=64391 RepID=A0A653BFW3_CALMS|nr:unnamed protein product [Callosobruchus maculatus]